jgi:phosphatidylglycerol:prolipoprotein diacylglycerol transferase
MCPEFFSLGPISIRAYGVTLALSFLLGLTLVRREARQIGLDPERIVNLAFVLILFGVIGGRVGYVIYHLSDFINQPLAIINPFGASGQFGISGLNLQGGLLGGLLAGIVYIRRARLPLAAALDAVVPATAFGIFLTRIGCFFNGCCFGNPTSGWLGVTFPFDSPAQSVFGSVAVHPTQLYSSLYALGLVVALMYLNRHSYRPGRTFGVFLAVEALFRFVIEPFRYYEGAMYFESGGFRITYNQIVALSMFVIGVVFVVRSRFAAPVQAQKGVRKA